MRLLEVVLFNSFWVKNLPPSLPVPLQEYGQRDMVYQAVFSLPPTQLRRTHTRCSQRTRPASSSLGDVPPSPHPLLPRVSSTRFWVQVGKTNKCKRSQAPWENKNVENKCSARE